jgi:hypothetical protein
MTMTRDSTTERRDEFESRVTIDFDGDKARNFRFEAVKIYHNLREVADDVEVHVSSGQGGLHFVAWFRDELPFHEKIAIRRAHGDDPRRTDMDVQRWQNGIFTGVLFQEKGHAEDARKERRFADVHDALDYIYSRRDDAERMNRLANRGHKGEPELIRHATEVK